HEQERQEAERLRQEEVQAEHARQAAEQARKEQEQREWNALVDKLVVFGAVAVVGLTIGIYIASRTTPARERARVVRLRHQIEDQLKILEQITKGLGHG